VYLCVHTFTRGCMCVREQLCVYMQYNIRVWVWEYVQLCTHAWVSAHAYIHLSNYAIVYKSTRELHIHSHYIDVHCKKRIVFLRKKCVRFECKRCVIETRAHFLAAPSQMFVRQISKSALNVCETDI